MAGNLAAGRVLMSSLGNYGKRNVGHAALAAGGLGIAAYGAKNADRRGLNSYNGAMMGAGALAAGFGLHGMGASQMLSSAGRANVGNSMRNVGREAYHAGASAMKATEAGFNPQTSKMPFMMDHMRKMSAAGSQMMKAGTPGRAERYAEVSATRKAAQAEKFRRAETSRKYDAHMAARAAPEVRARAAKEYNKPYHQTPSQFPPGPNRPGM